MLSVGIDIGTSTSQVIFSHLTIENTAGYFSVPSVEIVGKEIIYKSPVYRTPLLDRSLIDGAALKKILEKEYQSAGVVPAQVETGAAIITGESARKENASMVLDELSVFAGDFVVSTAGPDLESVIAGQGSGAWKYSEDNGVVVANLDIGGGTTNVVLFDGGVIGTRGCMDIGGRQVTVDEHGRITYVSPSAAAIAKALRLSINEGDPADEAVLSRLCDGMAEVLEEMLGAAEPTELLEEVRTAGSSTFEIPAERPIRYICFSGSVAECIYHPGMDVFAYGDIGILLADAIRRSRLFSKFHVISAQETIRATVIGAGTYTTTISGSTIAYADGLFPMKNIPVLKLSEAEENDCWLGKSEGLKEKILWFLKQSDSSKIVLAVNGKKNPGYTELKTFAAALGDGMHATIPTGEPLLFVVREDMAKALGQLLRQRFLKERNIVVIDEIRVEDNNFVDFGKPVMNGLVIPVVVKTLLFG